MAAENDKAMNVNQKVEDFFDTLDHPLIDVMHRIREIILSTDNFVLEDIKWGAPTFMYEGNIATFNVRAKKFVNLTFHTGALIPGNHPILEGDAKEARVARFESMDDVESKADGLREVIRAWVKMQDTK